MYMDGPICDILKISYNLVGCIRVFFLNMDVNFRTLSTCKHLAANCFTH